MIIINWLIKLFKKLKRRWIIAKAYPALKAAAQDQVENRKKLKSKIMVWLVDYFGINAKSKYIPKSYKNKAEVKEAVLKKFGLDMDKLNIQYSDIFK